MATKKLGDVVAIRPELFDETTDANLLKEEIEIHKIGLYVK